MKTFVLVLCCLLAVPAHAQRYKAQATTRDNAQMAQQLQVTQDFDLARFLKDPQEQHWVAFYMAAKELFAQGKKDDALTWFYAGQVRARVAAGIDPDPSRNNAMLVAMNSGIGAPIMAYAKDDKANWGARIDEALAWDKAHPMAANPKQVIGISDVAFDTANFRAVYDEVRAGLAQMREGLGPKAAPTDRFLPIGARRGR